MLRKWLGANNCLMADYECAETCVLRKAVEGADFCGVALLVATVSAILQDSEAHVLITMASAVF